MPLFFGVIVGLFVLGLSLILRARSLSLRYNAWTTGIRERNPKFNPPPTPDMRAMNTKIMTQMFRIIGIVLFVPLIMFLIAVFRAIKLK